MVKECSRHSIGIRRIATDDGGLILQLLFTTAIITAGIFLHLNALQWTIVSLLSIVFLITGVYRSAAHLLIRHDHTMPQVQAVRVKALSNMIMAVTAGISFFAYLMIFMPKINQLL